MLLSEKWHVKVIKILLIDYIAEIYVNKNKNAAM
jgi:hypothetical protein